MAVPRQFRCLCALLLFCVLLLQRLVTCGEDRCAYKTKHLWTAPLRESPLSATPTFFDVDGDGYGDIVAPSFSGEVWSIHGESGHIVDNWPFYLEERAFHSTPLIYDVNKDGVLEFLLTTSDAEILFLHPNNSLLHGETIKIAPLKVRRSWYRLDKAYMEKIVGELNKQIGDSGRVRMRDGYWLVLQDQGGQDEKRQEPPDQGATKNLHQHSEVFSEFESRYGRHADPLYSRHQPDSFTHGLDPHDQETVYVDPHVLATPTLADTNGDGHFDELVVPVSYYFNPYYYGDPHNLAQLSSLRKDELVHFVAAGIVIIDLTTGAVIGQKVLGLTEANNNQPAYLLSSPTVIRLSPGGGGAMIVVATATGEITMLEAGTLNEVAGFPVRVDSVSAAVATADLSRDGYLDLVVGDNSGNVYCIDYHGNRLWEFESGESIQSEVRFADIDGDEGLDVVFVTTYGTLWVLKGGTGSPLPGYPISLNTHSESAPLLMHLSHTPATTSATTSSKTESLAADRLTAVVPGSNEIYFIDLAALCVHTLNTDSAVLGVISGDVDPFNPGLEILSIGLDGKITCYSSPSPSLRKASIKTQIALESWNPDLMGHTRFTHQSYSVTVLLPWEYHTTIDLHGNSFTMDVTILDHSATWLKQITLSLSVGRKHLLYNDTLHLNKKTTSHTITVQTPPVSMATFVVVTACTEHLQCQSMSHHVRFNLGYQQTLRWFLCGPFVALTIAFLWILRDADSQSLPVYSSSNRKSL